MATNGEMAGAQPNTGSHQPNGIGRGPQVLSTTDNFEIVCGPLLNYRRMSGAHTESPIWHGSVLVVTTPGQQPEPLELECVSSKEGSSGKFKPVKLYEDPCKGFWRWEIEVPFLEEESEWAYHIPRISKAPRGLAGGLGGETPAKPLRFFVPSKHESMRIM